MIGGEVEHISVDLPVYADTNIFVVKATTLTWNKSKIHLQKTLGEVWRNTKFILYFDSKGCTRMHACFVPSHVKTSLIGLSHT